MTKHTFSSQSIVAFVALDSGTKVMSSITSTQTIFKFYNTSTFATLLYSFTLSQTGHSGTGQSKLALQGDVT